MDSLLNIIDKIRHAKSLKDWPAVVTRCEDARRLYGDDLDIKEHYAIDLNYVLALMKSSAESSVEEAIVVLDNLSMLLNGCNQLHKLATVYQQLGWANDRLFDSSHDLRHLQASLAHYRHSLSLFQSLDLTQNMALVSEAIGDLLCRHGKLLGESWLPEAIERLTCAFELYESMGRNEESQDMLSRLRILQGVSPHGDDAR